MKREEITRLRKQLDRTDEEILSLLRERMAVAAKVQAMKRRMGVGVYDPGRERAILRRLARKRSRLLAPGVVEAIFGEILSASRSAGGAIRIAFPGPEFNGSHWAGRSLFGRSAAFLPCPGKEGVYRALREGSADYGIVPAPPGAGAPRRRGIKVVKVVGEEARESRKRGRSFFVVERDHRRGPSSRGGK